MKRALQDWTWKQWAAIAAVVTATIVVVWMVVAAFTGSSDTTSSPGAPFDPLDASQTPAPPFSIPKVGGCTTPDTGIVAKIDRTLQPGTGLRNAQATTDGHTTYIAAVITSGGIDARDEPGLWATHGGVLLALGATATISSATPGDSVGLNGTTDAASRAVSCAAGY